MILLEKKSGRIFVKYNGDENDYEIGSQEGKVVRKNKKYGNSIPGIGEAREMITLLANSVHFFLECVFIVVYKDRYRLVVSVKEQLLTDQSYKTLRGARIAFHRLYRNYAFKRDIKPVWTPFYFPLEKWLQLKLSGHPADEAREPAGKPGPAF